MEAEDREAIDESEEAPYGTIWIAEGPKLHECLDTPQQQQQQQQFESLKNNNIFSQIYINFES